MKNLLYLDLSKLKNRDIDKSFIKLFLSCKFDILKIRILDIRKTWTSDAGI